MKRVLFLVVVCLVLLNVSAIVETLGTFKQNEDVELLQSGTGLNYCNITSVKYPDSSEALGHVQMTKDGTEYNYTFTQTSNIGTYLVNGFCSNGSDSIVWAYDFEVTPTGVLQTTSQGIGSAIYLILMLFLTGLFLYGGFKFSESEYLWVLGIFSIFLCFIFVVYDVWLAYEYQKNWTGMALSGMPETLFYMFLILLVSGFLVSLALLFTKWKKLYKYIKKEIKDKKEEQEMDEMDDWEGWGK